MVQAFLFVKTKKVSSMSSHRTQRGQFIDDTFVGSSGPSIGYPRHAKSPLTLLAGINASGVPAFFALFWCGISFPMAALFWMGGSPWWVKVFVSVFVVIGIGVLTLAWRQSVLAWRFAGTSVRFVPAGPQAGESFEVELALAWSSQTSAAIKSLLGLAPKTARRIGADGQEEDIPLTHVHTGDHLRVRPGEKVPVDGVVTDGNGQMLGDDVLDQIASDLQQLYDALASRELSAGSAQARRLFS